jgi:hypothetical protein
MQTPECANAKEGLCARSDTYVANETDTAFVIRCKTCSGINVWPKDNSENLGRYEAGLQQELKIRQAREAFDKRTRYSI